MILIIPYQQRPLPLVRGFVLGVCGVCHRITHHRVTDWFHRISMFHVTVGHHFLGSDRACCSCHGVDTGPGTFVEVLSLGEAESLPFLEALERTNPGLAGQLRAGDRVRASQRHGPYRDGVSTGRMAKWLARLERLLLAGAPVGDLFDRLDDWADLDKEGRAALASEVDRRAAEHGLLESLDAADPIGAGAHPREAEHDGLSVPVCSTHQRG